MNEDNQLLPRGTMTDLIRYYKRAWQTHENEVAGLWERITDLEATLRVINQHIPRFEAGMSISPLAHHPTIIRSYKDIENTIREVLPDESFYYIERKQS